jgi:phosphoserine aminotransferase
MAANSDMRAFNFSAGPSALPTEVLLQAQQELLDWQGLGVSVMEISHRSEAFTQVARQAEADLRQLLAIPDHYAVLFLQGGASSQFAMVPLNLMATGQADYIDTGIWSQKAIKEALRFGQVKVAATSKDLNYSDIPPLDQWQLNPQADYVHYTPNETIGGLEFHWVPDTDEVPLVADMSSTLLSRPLDVSQFGLIYAGAQKNLGPAGVTLVIVKRDLLGRAQSHTPSLYNYQILDQHHSMYNTPPTFVWYLTGLVLQWVQRQGGLAALASINERKARLLYDCIDQSDFYLNDVVPACRSWMNVSFHLADSTLDSLFLQQAQQANLLHLKGHRLQGGMRASLYNAVPESAVIALIKFMAEFERDNG